MNKDILIKFNTISNIFILFILLFGGFIWADSNGVWTLASDIRPGIFGSDENDGNYTFNDSVLLEKDSYYKGEELNQKYVNSDGDVIDGNLFVNGNVHSNKTYSNEYYMNTQNLDDRYASSSSFSNYYNKTESDNRYVNEGQVNSINSTMIVDNSIGGDELQDSINTDLNINGNFTVNGQTIATENYVDSNSGVTLGVGDSVPSSVICNSHTLNPGNVIVNSGKLAVVYFWNGQISCNSYNYKRHYFGNNVWGPCIAIPYDCY